jgi:hypothetical protein
MFSASEEEYRDAGGAQVNKKEPAMFMMNVSRLILVLVLPLATAQAQNHHAREGAQPESLDPMNRPMEELGVKGHDTTLCSDRWYSCTSYDRQQFDQKYPGRPLNELLRYGEPNWPDRDGRRGGSGTFHDSLDYRDRQGKE